MMGRYTDLEDLELASVLAAEDAAEDVGALDGDDRRTCFTHRCWVEACADLPMHGGGGADR